MMCDCKASGEVGKKEEKEGGRKKEREKKEEPCYCSVQRVCMDVWRQLIFKVGPATVEHSNCRYGST